IRSRRPPASTPKSRCPTRAMDSPTPSYQTPTGEDDSGEIRFDTSSRNSTATGGADMGPLEEYPKQHRDCTKALRQLLAAVPELSPEQIHEYATIINDMADLACDL